MAETDAITPSAPPGSLTAAERILLHAPVALFAVPAALLSGLALALGGPVRIAALTLAWWSLSGAVMMAVDARGRLGRYLRLAALADRKGNRTDGWVAPRGIRDSVCGLFMSWALRCRHHAGRHNSIW